MAEIYDLVAYRKQKEEQETKQTPAGDNNPTLEEMATVMVMSSDELFVELLARVEFGKSLREDQVATSTLITELTNRALHMELLCEMASNLSK
mgnify:CR=1 FL=1